MVPNCTTPFASTGSGTCTPLYSPASSTHGVSAQMSRCGTTGAAGASFAAGGFGASGACHGITVPGIAQTPRVSPDGKRIALLVTLGAEKEAGATQPGVRMIGEIAQEVWGK